MLSLCKVCVLQSTSVSDKTISVSFTFDNSIPCLIQVHHSYLTSQDSDASKGLIWSIHNQGNHMYNFRNYKLCFIL